MFWCTSMDLILLFFWPFLSPPLFNFTHREIKATLLPVHQPCWLYFLIYPTLILLYSTTVPLNSEPTPSSFHRISSTAFNLRSTLPPSFAAPISVQLNATTENHILEWIRTTMDVWPQHDLLICYLISDKFLLLFLWRVAPLNSSTPSLQCRWLYLWFHLEYQGYQVLNFCNPRPPPMSHFYLYLLSGLVIHANERESRLWRLFFFLLKAIPSISPHLLQIQGIILLITLFLLYFQLISFLRYFSVTSKSSNNTISSFLLY